MIYPISICLDDEQKTTSICITCIILSWSYEQVFWFLQMRAANPTPQPPIWWTTVSLLVWSFLVGAPRLGDSAGSQATAGMARRGIKTLKLPPPPPPPRQRGDTNGGADQRNDGKKVSTQLPRPKLWKNRH